MRSPKLLPFLIATALLGAVPAAAVASTPPTQDVTVPAAGQTTTLRWTGTIPPGANPTSDCNRSATDDQHQVKVNVPAGYYDTATAEFTFKITWQPTVAEDTSDEILTVNGSKDEVGSSDGSGTSEMVVANDLKADAYNAIACGFANAGPQDYQGELTIRTKAKSPEPSVPSAPARGLEFSASVPSDNQRDESEPLMEIAKDGKIYACGPTGFSNASDYAQVSTDGGDQFHLMGTPPRGQQGGGGGGDCGLGTGVEKNADGQYQYAYAGLGPLTGFTTSTSPDGGRTIYNAGPQGNTNTAKGGGADRQWITFLDDKTALLNYNQQVPRNVVVQRSTNGGFTYLTGNDAVAAGNPDFPGPMRTMAAGLVTPGARGNVAYFGWNTSDDKFSYVNLSISDASGLRWTNCVVQRIPLDQSGGLGAFTVADNDTEGNLYLTYSDKKAFHTYLTTLTHDKVKDCDEPVHPNTGASGGEPPAKNPGWSQPIQVDRDEVRTTVFPWLVAGGEPGRVAISFYGTESNGDPNPGSFKASWDVYVAQSLNALSPERTVSQVKATTHPFHYDSICLRGLGCDLSSPPGDRSLADFFAIDYNPVTKKLSLVYDQSSKKPDDAAGIIATPAVVNQVGGPSNGGSDVGPVTRPAVRTSSTDPGNDALVNFSSLQPGVSSTTGARTGAAVNEPAMDFLSEDVGDEVDPVTGAKVANGGFTVKFKLADLSDAALRKAMADTQSKSLLWVFRFVNGYQASAASARYNPAQGFTFGYNDYTTGSAECGSSGDKCIKYPGDKAIKGRVDQAKGTITLSVPRAFLVGLNGPTGDMQRPTLTKAQPGTRFYDATLFSLGNVVSPTQDVQSFLYPADNTPAMDFELPGKVIAPTPKPVQLTSTTSTTRGSRCTVTSSFRSVSARARGRGVRLGFSRRRAGRVTVDVFQSSAGRRVIGERLVARFRGKRSSFTWNGRANRRGRRVTNGIYFVRYRLGRDVRRVVLERRGGAFRRRPDFYRRASCRLLRSFKLGRPAFGGTTTRPLTIAFRLGRTSRVQVQVLRGRRVVKRFATRRVRAHQTQRLRFAARGRRRGDYRVRVRVRGVRTVTATLVSKRL